MMIHTEAMTEKEIILREQLGIAREEVAELRVELANRRHTETAVGIEETEKYKSLIEKVKQYKAENDDLLRTNRNLMDKVHRLEVENDNLKSQKSRKSGRCFEFNQRMADYSPPDTSMLSSNESDEVAIDPQLKSAFGYTNVFTVHGYIRKHCKNFIDEICKICIAFYGLHWIKLIDFSKGDHLSSLIGHHALFKDGNFKLDPFIQYVDGHFMIAYGYKEGFFFIEWSGFLRIDLRTRIVQKLMWFVDGQPFECVPSWQLLQFVNNASADAQDSRSLQLMVSDPLTEDWTEYSQFEREEERKNEKWRPWNAFNDNLWKMFDCDSLYFPNADDEWIEHQPIWSVIQLLSVMYFNYKQKRTLTVPAVQFKDKWNFSDDAFYETDDEIADVENADKMNAKTGIIEYRRGIRMKAICYLSVDWGGEYQCIGGYDRNMYLATFVIEKGENFRRPIMQIAFETVKSQSRIGTQLS